MTILRNPQIAELIEAGCAFKSNVIISKNETMVNVHCLNKLKNYFLEIKHDLNCTFFVVSVPLLKTGGGEGD